MQIGEESEPIEVPLPLHPDLAPVEPLAEPVPEPAQVPA